MTQTLLSLSQVSTHVKQGNGEKLTTVDNVSLTLNQGQTYALVGKSGAGKTSLISIIGLLNRKFSGSYIYQNKEIGKLSDRECSRIRAINIGFVFQNYSLIKHLRVWENIELSLIYAQTKMGRKRRQEAVMEVLESVGLAERKNDLPAKLSGGEQQRVAIARALVTSPRLLICDEPTGALDAATSARVLELLNRLVSEYKTTLLLVTHDEDLAATFNTIITMSQGAITDVSNAH